MVGTPKGGVVWGVNSGGLEGAEGLRRVGSALRVKGDVGSPLPTMVWGAVGNPQVPERVLWGEGKVKIKAKVEMRMKRFKLKGGKVKLRSES